MRRNALSDREAAVAPKRRRGPHRVAARLHPIGRREVTVGDRALSMVLDLVPVAAKMLDADGLGCYFNPTWLRMTGRNADEAMGPRWLETIHPDDRGQCEQAYQAALESRQPMTMDYRVRRYDGTFGSLLDCSICRYDVDGRFAGLVSASLDINDKGNKEAKLRDLGRRLVSAQEDERRRIARELHDDVNQRLALLAIDIEQLILSMREDDPLQSRLRDLWVRTSEISHEVHNVSHELHSSTLDALGLVAAIRTLARELSQKGLYVTFTGDVAANDISPAVALALFRVAQEALTNVLRHSGVREATLCLSSSDDVMALRVEDRGCGFDLDSHEEGLGLLSMRERLLALGGDLRIRSRPGGGTTIEARVPRSAADLDVDAPAVAVLGRR